VSLRNPKDKEDYVYSLENFFMCCVIQILRSYRYKMLNCAYVNTIYFVGKLN